MVRIRAVNEYGLRLFSRANIGVLPVFHKIGYIQDMHPHACLSGLFVLVFYGPQDIFVTVKGFQ
jgi:hypothetical protein